MSQFKTPSGLTTRIPVLLCFIFYSSFSFAQLRFSGIVKYSPKEDGIIADLKVDINYEPVAEGILPKISFKLLSLKGINFAGKTYALNQLPVSVLSEYMKLPADIDIKFDVLKGAATLKDGLTGKNGQILWQDILGATASQSLSSEDLKAKGSGVFFSAAMSIKNVAISSIPFDAASIEKHLKGTQPQSIAANGAKPANKPAVKTMPASYITAPAPRILKQSTQNLNQIFLTQERRNDELDNASELVTDIPAFIATLQQRAIACRQFKAEQEQDFLIKLGNKDKKKNASLFTMIPELEKICLNGSAAAMYTLARAYTLAGFYASARNIYQNFAKNRDVHAYKMIAQTFQYEKRYYEAIQYYEKNANQGDSEAMKRLGAIYSGFLTLNSVDSAYPQMDSINYSVINLSSYPGVDFDKAVSWYEKAALTGDTEAMVLLYNLLSGEDEKRYLAGERTPNNFVFRKDPAKAQFWLTKAIAAGDKDALVRLTKSAAARSMPSAGLLFGEGVKAYDAKNFSLAFAKIRKAAELRNQEAMVKLAAMLAAGTGCPKDEQQAYSWLQKAAMAGYVPSYYPLANFLQQGRGVPKSLMKAYDYYLLGANSGVPQAMGQLGFMFYQGAGIERNLKKSLKYFIEAKEFGFSDADFYIGNIFRFGGNGIRPDGALAVSWYQKSINGTDFGGYKFIADTYASDRSDIHDYKKAVENYKVFLENEKNPEVLKAHREAAIREIARLYSSGGYGLDQDEEKAREWLKKLE